MGHVFVSFLHCSIIFTWANIQHFTLQIYHMAVMFFVCVCVLKPLFFLWLKAIIQLLPLDFALEWSQRRVQKISTTNEKCWCFEWLSFHVFSRSYTYGNYLILSTWYFFDIIDIILVKSVRSMKRERLGVHSWARGASIKWECGCMNVVVAHQLLPLTVLGNYLFKSFLSMWCIKDFLCYDVIHVFLILVSYIFSFLLAGQMMVGTFQESYAHVMVLSFACGSLFWSRSWCIWIHNINMQSL